MKANTSQRIYKPIILLCTIFLALGNQLFAQTLYVDAAKGNDQASGAVNAPLASLEQAVLKTNSFTENKLVKIKVAPGLYLLSHELFLKTATTKSDTNAYTIEAMVMPDDKIWQPDKMPVIQCVSSVNDTTGFPHCIGMAIEKDNVHLKGLKFLGNPNNEVPDYYPIRRADKTLNGLFVSQCFFIGEPNSSAIQSAFWVSGPGVHVNYCIFHNSKIAMVLGSNFNDFSFTNSIVDGAYNTAIWYGSSGMVPSFTFQNNVFTNCYYILVYPAEKGQPKFSFRNLYLYNNAHELGSYPKAQDKFLSQKAISIKEVNVIRNRKITLVDVKNDGITHDNLNLSSSVGQDTSAGLFTIKHP